MPARIVVVHDDRAFLRELVTLLHADAHDVVGFSDSLSAWEAFRNTSKIEVLVTRVQFGPGQPHGIALAQWAKSSRPDIQVIFTALPEFQSEVEELGIFLALPVDPLKVAEIITEFLQTARYDRAP